MDKIYLVIRLRLLKLVLRLTHNPMCGCICLRYGFILFLCPMTLMRIRGSQGEKYITFHITSESVHDLIYNFGHSQLSRCILGCKVL